MRKVPSISGYDYSHNVIFEPLSSFEQYSCDAQAIKLHCLGCYCLSLFTMATWTEFCYKADTNINLLNMLHVSRNHIRVLWFRSFIVCFLMSASFSGGCGSPVSYMVVEFQCLTWLWNFSVSYGCGISVSQLVVKFQCLIWLWNSSVPYAYPEMTLHLLICISKMVVTQLSVFFIWSI